MELAPWKYYLQPLKSWKIFVQLVGGSSHQLVGSQGRCSDILSSNESTLAKVFSFPPIPVCLLRLPPLGWSHLCPQPPCLACRRTGRGGRWARLGSWRGSGGAVETWPGWDENRNNIWFGGGDMQTTICMQGQWLWWGGRRETAWTPSTSSPPPPPSPLQFLSLAPLFPSLMSRKLPSLARRSPQSWLRAT